jgi:phosphoglycolate phosphatase
MLRYRAILFDLDGTLTDPAVGIVRSIQYAFERMEQPVPPTDSLLHWIGPPLRDSFALALGGDRVLAEQAVILYRERYGTVGLFENEVYSGIPALLAELNATGSRLFLATSKPQPYAERILEHFNLARHFAAVGGATLDGRIGTKAEVIGELLPRLTPAERAACVMVGDREHDVHGAQFHGMSCIGVGYGYGSEAELTAAGAAAVVASVGELGRALLHPAC